MRNCREYLWAGNPIEALHLLQHHPGRGAFLGGGTCLAARHDEDLDFVVDLTRLDLGGIVASELRLDLGATVPLQTLVENPRVGALADGILRTAAELTRTEPWRRQATVAGRLVEGEEADLLCPALMVLGARLVALCDADAVPVEMDLEVGLARAAGGALVLGILVPVPGPGWGFALETLSRSALDRPLAAIAAGVQWRDGRILEARIATSGVPRPRRAAHVEAILAGRVADAAAFAAAQEALLDDIVPPSDHRATAAYRTHLARVLLARALRRATDSARERSSRALAT
jgi:carbon-monoxide dehydrogenase medium subunit